MRAKTQVSKTQLGGGSRPFLTNAFLERKKNNLKKLSDTPLISIGLFWFVEFHKNPSEKPETSSSSQDRPGAGTQDESQPQARSSNFSATAVFLYLSRETAVQRRKEFSRSDSGYW